VYYPDLFLITLEFRVLSGIIRDNHLIAGLNIDQPQDLCKYSMNQKPKLLDQVRAVARARHLSHKTEDAYHNFIKRFILFHDKRHPREMGTEEISAFLTHLAVQEKVAASTQNQALFALLFLYRDVLKIDLPRIEGVVRANRPERLPVVFTQREARAILAELSGVPFLVAGLLYGAGLRLTESLRLRVKDLDFEKNQIIVREGKGAKESSVESEIYPRRRSAARVRRGLAAVRAR
jgi:site-specific recombinase XerD